MAPYDSSWKYWFTEPGPVNIVDAACAGDHGCEVSFVKLMSRTATFRGPGDTVAYVRGARTSRCDVVDVQAALVEHPADAEAHPVREVLAPVPEPELDLPVPLAQRVVVARLLGPEVVRVRELQRALDRDRVGAAVVRETGGW